MEEFDQDQSGQEQLDEVEEEPADLDSGEELGDEDVDLEGEDGGDDI